MSFLREENFKEFLYLLFILRWNVKIQMMLQIFLLTFQTINLLGPRYVNEIRSKWLNMLVVFFELQKNEFFKRRKFQRIFILVVYFKVKCQDPNDASKFFINFPNYQFIRTKVRQWNTFKMTECVSCFLWIKKNEILEKKILNFLKTCSVVENANCLSKYLFQKILLIFHKRQSIRTWVTQLRYNTKWQKSLYAFLDWKCQFLIQIKSWQLFNFCLVKCQFEVQTCFKKYYQFCLPVDL